MKYVIARLIASAGTSLFCGFVVVFFSLSLSKPATAQDCEFALEDSRLKYDAGGYLGTIELLKGCVDQFIANELEAIKQLPRSEKRWYIDQLSLLSQAYIAIDDQMMALYYAHIIMDIDPYYFPDERNHYKLFVSFFDSTSAPTYTVTSVIQLLDDGNARLDTTIYHIVSRDTTIEIDIPIDGPVDTTNQIVDSTPDDTTAGAPPVLQECEFVLEDAQLKFDAGGYREAIELLTRCVDHFAQYINYMSRLPYGEKGWYIAHFSLISESYIAIDNPERALFYARIIRIIDPIFIPSARDHHKLFISFFNSQYDLSYEITSLVRIYGGDSIETITTRRDTTISSDTKIYYVISISDSIPSAPPAPPLPSPPPDFKVITKTDTVIVERNDTLSTVRLDTLRITERDTIEVHSRDTLEIVHTNPTLSEHKPRLPKFHPLTLPDITISIPRETIALLPDTVWINTKPIILPADTVFIPEWTETIRVDTLYITDKTVTIIDSTGAWSPIAFFVPARPYSGVPVVPSAYGFFSRTTPPYPVPDPESIPSAKPPKPNPLRIALLSGAGLISGGLIVQCITDWCKPASSIPPPPGFPGNN